MMFKLGDLIITNSEYAFITRDVLMIIEDAETVYSFSTYYKGYKCRNLTRDSNKTFYHRAEALEKYYQLATNLTLVELAMRIL